MPGAQQNKTTQSELFQPYRTKFGPLDSPRPSGILPILNFQIGRSPFFLFYFSGHWKIMTKQNSDHSLTLSLENFIQPYLPNMAKIPKSDFGF